MPLYFAYGSNLDTGQMRERCPSAAPLGIGKLSGHRLAFSRFSRTRGCGVADIIPGDEDDVWGLVYDLSEADLTGKLDHYEGYPHKYTRLVLTVEMVEGVRLEAWVYSVVDKREHVAPDDHYLDIMRSAAAELGFPAAYRSMLDDLRPTG